MIVHNYNVKVVQLRQKKERLITTLTAKTELLKAIHTEIPENIILKPPPIPVLTEEDYPEKNIKVKLTVEKDFKTYLESLKQKPKTEEEISEVCHYTDWEKAVFGIETLPDVPGNCRNIINHLIASPDSNFSPYGLEIPEEDDMQKTFWDMEIEYRRLLRKIHDQRTLINEMNTEISNFDDEVQELSKERFLIIRHTTYLEMHILVLNEELTIVRAFEVVEIGLSDIAFQKWNEMMDERDNMRRIEGRIEAHNFNIEGFLEDIKVVQQTFLTAAKDNKFWDFLRRIFKKKFRPPKVADDSDSSSFSSESSSESEEDDDAGSIDSRDIGPIRLDESICPKGCDRELYDYTFVLRTKRHELESLIKEEQKTIELCKKEMDQAAKKVKLCEQLNQKAQDDLEEYQHLKQKKLNEINCTVLLHLSQLQHLNADGHSVAKLSDTLVFDVPACKILHKRVEELRKETLEQLTRFKMNKLHLHRMNVDCKHMTNTIAKLKKDITEKMILKFGSPVEVDDIEEAVLKRMILNLRVSMLNIGKMYEKDIDALRVLYGEKQIELKNTIRENTARLEVLALLNREKRQLEDMLDKLAKAKDKMNVRGVQTYYTKDVSKLQAVAKNQEQQIEMLKTEIKLLTTKDLPPERLPCEEPVKEEVEITGDFGSLDDLYDSSHYLPERDEEFYGFKPLDESISEDEIILCIHELMKEIIDAVTGTDQSQEEKVVTALSGIVDQVPMEYLLQRESVQYIRGLINEMIEEPICRCAEFITKGVARATRRTVEEIGVYIEEIVITLGAPAQHKYEDSIKAGQPSEATDEFEDNWTVEGEEIRQNFETKYSSVHFDLK